jgi:UDP-xylose:glucoside alpha-1,3-xylosyltransferase
MYMDVCKTDSVKIIHGNRGYFHSPAQPIFKSIYQSIEEYRFNTNPYTNIIEKIELNIDIPSKSNCDKLIEKFLKTPKTLLKNIDYKNSDDGSYS